MNPVDLALALVRFDTINPPGNEEPCAEHLARLLEEHGFTVERHAFAPTRVGLVARLAGTDAAQLREGPGHYPGTPLPGRHGTVAVAGHRTTYLAPFRHLDALESGDEIEVTMPYGRFSYRVDRTRIVAPTALWVTRPVGHDQIVLTACNPLYSAAQRIVVFARLATAIPRGWAAR